MNKNMIITAVVVVVVGAGGFVGGMKYQESRLPATGAFRRTINGTSNQGQFQGMRQNVQGGPTGQGMNKAFGSTRPIMGEIIAQDDKSITVKLQDGSTRIVFLADSTTINKADQASKSDLKVGEKVNVFGTQSPEGTYTAQNIQLNPVVMMLQATPSAAPKQ